jgi:hypothetical protein
VTLKQIVPQKRGGLNGSMQLPRMRFEILIQSWPSCGVFSALTKRMFGQVPDYQPIWRIRSRMSPL